MPIDNGAALSRRPRSAVWRAAQPRVQPRGLFQKASTGAPVIWTMSGTSVTAAPGFRTTANFAVASEGHGGTLVTDPPTPQQIPLAQSHG